MEGGGTVNSLPYGAPKTGPAPGWPWRLAFAPLVVVGALAAITVTAALCIILAPVIVVLYVYVGQSDIWRYES